MCISSTEALYRVRFLYLLKNGSSIKKVRYLRIVPTRKSLIYSAVNQFDDDSKLKDIDISVESVPLNGGVSTELVHINFTELCEKLFRG